MTLIIEGDYLTHDGGDPVLTHFDPGPHYLGICVNLGNGAVSQYAGFNFNSFAKIGETYVGASNKGLFTLGGDSDAGVYIDSFFESIMSDFGIPNQKRMRSVYIGYETDGNLTFTIKDDEGNARSVTLTAIETGELQHGGKFFVGRDGKGRYWWFKIQNSLGCDFAIDSIEVLPIILHRRPAGM